MNENKAGNLALIRSSASTTRVMNLVHLAEKNAQSDDFQAKPLFRNKRLNQTIIVKHSPRAHERPLFDTYRSSATKIIFPIDTTELQLGGQSIFFEERDAKRKLAGFLDLSEMDPAFVDDCQLLIELSKMPSFDPYLLRERVHALGFDVAREYFAISDADIEKISNITRVELLRLVELAFRNEMDRLGVMADKFNQLFLNRETDEALQPLTMAIGLPADKHREAMFSWKGFLYYKWRLNDIMMRLPPIVGQLKSMRVFDASADERTEVDRLIQKVLDGVEDALRSVRASLSGYDASFDNMVQHQRPADFQRFLLNAPKAFDNVGEALSKVMHIVSFWEFRFAKDERLRLSYADAVDILDDFSAQLSAYSSASKKTRKAA